MYQIIQRIFNEGVIDPFLGYFLILVGALIDIISLTLVIRRAARGRGPSGIPVISWMLYMYAVIFSRTPIPLDGEPALLFRILDGLLMTIWHAFIQYFLVFIISRIGRLGDVRDSEGDRHDDAGTNDPRTQRSPAGQDPLEGVVPMETLTFKALLGDGQPNDDQPLREESSSLEKWHASILDTPISDFTMDDLCRSVRQEMFLEHVLPVALRRLQDDPQSGELRDGELASAIARISKRFWQSHPELASETRKLMESQDYSFDDTVREEVSAFLRWTPGG